MKLTLWRRSTQDAMDVHATTGNHNLIGGSFFCGLAFHPDDIEVNGKRVGLSSACKRCWKEVMRRIASGELKVTVT